MSILVIMQNGVRFRAQEEKMLSKHFGKITLIKDLKNIIDTDYVFWHPNTELITLKQFDLFLKVNLKSKRIINPIENFLAAHTKEIAFNIWNKKNIPCPSWFKFDKDIEVFNKIKKFPVLIRLNNYNTGKATFLVKNEKQLKESLKQLKRFSNIGLGSGKICVEYIETNKNKYGFNLSLRIIVAGDKVIAGYARLSDNWLAITKKFDSSMGEAFIYYQKFCEEFCRENEQLICRAVNVTGNNFQGVDVIFDIDNNPYFLEIQPGFSVGYSDRDLPFYNPNQRSSKKLVQFILENEDRFKNEVPFYYYNWLNKKTLFDKSFENLKKVLDEIIL